MANNRMYLVCQTCNPTGEADEVEGSYFRIAKYYPTTGWYPMPLAIHQWKELEDWFENHRHEDKTMWGTQSRFRIGYEIESEDGWK